MNCARRALVVGIDDYPSTPLNGCVNDAMAVSALLERHDDGSVNFDVLLRTSNTQLITKTSLRADIERLLIHDDAEVALLYFAGHGTETNLGGYLVTPDARRWDEGVSLTDVLALANQSKASEVIIVLDSCMSGQFGQLPASAPDVSTLRLGVSVLTAARGGQESMEADGRGVFTELFCAALAGGAADVLGKVNVAASYAYIEEALGPWDQRPLFKAHVPKLVTLRNAAPAVDPKILRRLPGWFSTADAEYPLDPSYEPDAEPSDPDNEEIFGCLQTCRAARLIEPVGAPHLYFAAVNSKACRLTPLGRHYWRLANAGKV